MCCNQRAALSCTDGTLVMLNASRQGCTCMKQCRQPYARAHCKNARHVVRGLAGARGTKSSIVMAAAQQVADGAGRARRACAAAGAREWLAAAGVIQPLPQRRREPAAAAPVHGPAALHRLRAHHRQVLPLIASPRRPFRAHLHLLFLTSCMGSCDKAGTVQARCH